MSRWASRASSKSRAGTSTPNGPTNDPLENGMNGRLQGKACIVTGGSAGIGEAIVRRFVDEGAKVLFCGTNAESGAAAERRFASPNAQFMRADVGVEADVEALVAEAARR